MIPRTFYDRLFQKFGPQKWWPAKTKFEVIVGAILTQNTNWTNVERAIRNLQRNKVVTPQAMRDVPLERLASLIKSAGYFNVKAKRLKAFVDFLWKDYNGSLKRMAREDWPALRHKLLQVKGIGPETADSILLYALDKPVFVIDAYTKRFLYRHNLIASTADYHSVQEMFMRDFVADKNPAQIFNEYHALIVRLGKEYCRKPKPRCEICPLNDLHYSLVNKCQSCHRALSEKSGWKSSNSTRIKVCLDCGA